MIILFFIFVCVGWYVYSSLLSVTNRQDVRSVHIHHVTSRYSCGSFTSWQEIARGCIGSSENYPLLIYLGWADSSQTCLFRGEGRDNLTKFSVLSALYLIRDSAQLLTNVRDFSLTYHQSRFPPRVFRNFSYTRILQRYSGDSCSNL